MDSMNGKRDLYLEANILLLLKKKKAMKSNKMALKLGVNIDQLRLSLANLSYEKIVHRSNSGIYRLDRDHRGSPRRASKLQVSSGSYPGEEAKSDIAPW